MISARLGKAREEKEKEKRGKELPGTHAKARPQGSPLGLFVDGSPQTMLKRVRGGREERERRQGDASRCLLCDGRLGRKEREKKRKSAVGKRDEPTLSFLACPLEESEKKKGPGDDAGHGFSSTGTVGRGREKEKKEREDACRVAQFLAFSAYACY